MNIAVITARGGSKRIPRKNIRTFAGKPMIAHAIDAAGESGLFEHIIVSTDDDEIADVAKRYGAEVPFMRPADLADDFTPTVPVVAHAIAACQSLGWHIENVCCIYPGVPFIQTNDLKAGYKLLVESGNDYCYPVTEFTSAIQRAFRRRSDGRMSPFYPEYELTRTQDLEPAYHDAGQFYWGKSSAWLKHGKMHQGLGLVIPSWRVVDIDTEDDWRRAEILFMAIKEMENPNERI